MFPFDRVLVADGSPAIDVALLGYVAGLLRRSPATEVTIAARPDLYAIRTLAPAACSAFASGGVERLSCRFLPEPDLDELLNAARECAADVIVCRAPSGRTAGRALRNRLLAESPCAFWLVPAGAEEPLRRILAWVDLDASGVESLRKAAAIGAAAGTAALAVVHPFAPPVLDPNPQTEERLSEARMYDLCCLAARVDMGEIQYSLRVEPCLNPRRVAARIVREVGAGLLVTDGAAADLADVMKVPMLCLPKRDPARGPYARAREWFALSELPSN